MRTRSERGWVPDSQSRPVDSIVFTEVDGRVLWFVVRHGDPFGSSGVELGLLGLCSGDGKTPRVR